jgi:UDP-N-acetylglucosamine--N-acetylmuramyl-(pentapeptide) pyrophosphoryl-undecaprenol N-acetylglucosamine transferase
LLAFGGSQGARSINFSLPAGLALLRRGGADFQVLHLAGKADAQAVERLYKESDVLARVLPYLDAMHLGYAAADMAVCRAGAATLAELAAQSKPALLIPYPSATAGHQESNALVFADAGAARMLREPVSAESIARSLDPLLGDRDILKGMSAAYGKVGLPRAEDCARMLADMVEKAAKGGFR